MTSPADQKFVVVTGGTAGIGLVTARELAWSGADVTIVGRDAARGAAAVAAISKVADRGSIEFVACDLSDQQKVREFAAHYSRRRPRLDVLVNNAGALFGRRQTSVDGIEMTFALNHLGYFLITALLLPALRNAPAARIVNVASEAHRGAVIDFDDLQGEMKYDRWRAYKRSKLANIMFTSELVRRLEGQPITANALHPGFVATEIGTRYGFVPSFAWKLGTLAAISPERGARTSIYLATSPDVAAISGAYFIACRQANSSAASHDRAAAERLWDISVNLTGTDAI